MTHKEVCYTLKELLEFSIDTDRNLRNVCGILRVQDNDGRNIKLDQAKFIHMCPLSKDSAFKGTAQKVRKGSNSLSGLLAETWWPTCE